MIDFDKRKWYGSNAFSGDEEEWRRKKVLEDLAESKTNYFYLGMHLLDIWNTMTYVIHTLDGVCNYSPKNFFDYCFVYFGLDKSQVSRYMNIVDEFGDGLRGFKAEFVPYTYSQLSEMLSLTPKQRKAITPDWTIKRIREYKKELAGKVATSQQPKEKVYKIYGEIRASKKGAEILSSVFEDFKEVNCGNLYLFIGALCSRLFVGYSYDGYNLTFTDKMKIISGMLCFAQDISISLGGEKVERFVNIEETYKALFNLGYIPIKDGAK